MASNLLISNYLFKKDSSWGLTRKVEMSRQTQMESVHVNIVPDGKCLCQDGQGQKVPMLRRSCVHDTSALSNYRICADFLSSCQDFRAYNRLISVLDQTFVRSLDFRVLAQNFRAFACPDNVNLNARHPRRAFIWVWTYKLSVWDLSTGSSKIQFPWYKKQSLQTVFFIPLSIYDVNQNGLFAIITPHYGLKWPRPWSPLALSKPWLGIYFFTGAYYSKETRNEYIKCKLIR